MAAAFHNKAFADRVGIPQEVAREFIEADKKEAEKFNQEKSKDSEPKSKK